MPSCWILWGVRSPRLADSLKRQTRPGLPSGSPRFRARRNSHRRSRRIGSATSGANQFGSQARGHSNQRIANEPKRSSSLTTKSAALQSRNRSQTSFNAETQRARSNAEEKNIFFLLSLRASANLCVSALILRTLRANPEIAVQRTQGSELGKEMAFTGQVVAPLCPTAYLSLGSMRSLWLNS